MKFFTGKGFFFLFVWGESLISHWTFDTNADFSRCSSFLDWRGEKEMSTKNRFLLLSTYIHRLSVYMTWGIANIHQLVCLCVAEATTDLKLELICKFRASCHTKDIDSLLDIRQNNAKRHRRFFYINLKHIQLIKNPIDNNHFSIQGIRAKQFHSFSHSTSSSSSSSSSTTTTTWRLTSHWSFSNIQLYTCLNVYKKQFRWYHSINLHPFSF